MAKVGIWFAYILPPIGLVLCIIALDQIKLSGERGRSLATAGSIIGLLGTFVIMIIIFMTSNMQFSS